MGMWNKLAPTVIFSELDRTQSAQLTPLDHTPSPIIVRKFSPLAIIGNSLAPLLIFVAFFHVEILNPTNIGWALNGDWGQHFLGWHALRQSPLTWPYNHESLLANPTGLSIIYTDSNPLLALPLRFFDRYLPKHVQYIGLWLFGCVLLHYFVSLMWIRKYASTELNSLICAAFITLMPTLYNRIGHDNLCAHWLILLMLFLFFEIRSFKLKFAGYSAVLCVSALVHPYILFMNLAIWCADALGDACAELRVKDWVKFARGAVFSSASLIPTVMGLWIAGAFSGQSVGADGFGIYGMPIDAFINPGRNDFSFAVLRGPQLPTMQFEGFQYLGFGILTLTSALTLFHFSRKTQILATEPDDAPKFKTLLLRAKRLRWPFLMLGFVALSDHIYVYNIKLLDLSFPRQMTEALNVVRASGRVVWPVVYTFVFLTLVYALRAPETWRTRLLIVALSLQILDLIGFAQSTRGLTAQAATPDTFSIAKSPKWDDVVRASRRVVFVTPAPGAQTRTFYEVILRALDLKKPVNMMYAARENAAQNALQRAEYLSFMSGATDPSQLYVLLNKSVPQGLQGRVRELDNVWVIAPAAFNDAAMVRPTPVPFRLDTDYDLGFDTPTGSWFGEDWYLPGVSSVDSLGSVAKVKLPYVQDAGRSLTLNLRLRGRRIGQGIRIYSEGLKLAELKVGKTQKTASVKLPPPLKATPVTITLEAVPASDDRLPGKVGVQLYRLRLTDHG